MKKHLKRASALDLSTVMAATMLFSGFVGINKAKAEETNGTTTVYYDFGTVSTFTEGSTYIFLADSAGVTVSQSSALLGLPDGCATLTSTGNTNDNGALSYIEQWNGYDQAYLQSEIANYQGYYNDMLAQKDTYINNYGFTEEEFNQELQSISNQISSYQNWTACTLDTYVDVAQAGTGFDTCRQGALCNSGTRYFCYAGGVKALSGKCLSYKTTTITGSNLSAKLKKSASEKVKKGPFTATKDDITVQVTIDGKTYETSAFEFTDATIDVGNNDTDITIKFGESTATIKVDASEAVEEEEDNANATVSGRDGTITVEKLKKNNTNTVVQKDSAAADAKKSVNDVIDILAGSDTSAKESLVSAAVEKGDLKVKVKNKNPESVVGSVNKPDMLLKALTAQELIDGITGNDTVELDLVISKKETSDVPSSVKQSVKDTAKEVLSDNANLYFFDSSLYLSKNGVSKQNLTEFGNNKLTIAYNMPAQVLGNGNNTVALISTHTEADGSVSVTSLKDIDSDPATYTTSSNKLCTMAFAYVEGSSVVTTTATAPKTGDVGGIYIFLMFLATAAFGYGAFVRVRRKSK